MVIEIFSSEGSTQQLIRIAGAFLQFNKHFEEFSEAAQVKYLKINLNKKVSRGA